MDQNGIDSNFNNPLHEQFLKNTSGYKIIFQIDKSFIRYFYFNSNLEKKSFNIFYLFKIKKLKPKKNGLIK